MDGYSQPGVSLNDKMENTKANDLVPTDVEGCRNIVDNEAKISCDNTIYTEAEYNITNIIPEESKENIVNNSCEIISDLNGQENVPQSQNQGLFETNSEGITTDIVIKTEPGISDFNDPIADQNHSSFEGIATDFIIKTEPVDESEGITTPFEDSQHDDSGYVVDRDGVIHLEYRNPSSSESSSDDESGPEDVPQQIDSDDSDDIIQGKTGKHAKPQRPIKTKGEMTVEDLPPIENLQITVDESVHLFNIGSVTAIVGVLVVVQGKPDLPALNTDSMLFTAERKSVGQVFETFGPVSCPLYTVRFNSPDEITERGIEQGTAVYYAPDKEEFTHYVFMNQLIQQKGSDASWEHNNEPPSKFLDYSDDEEERRAKRKGRNKNSTVEGDTPQNGPVNKVNKPNRWQNQKNDSGYRNPKIQSWPPQRKDMEGGNFFQPPPPPPMHYDTAPSDTTSQQFHMRPPRPMNFNPRFPPMSNNCPDGGYCPPRMFNPRFPAPMNGQQGYCTESPYTVGFNAPPHEQQWLGGNSQPYGPPVQGKTPQCDTNYTAPHSTGYNPMYGQHQYGNHPMGGPSPWQQTEPTYGYGNYRHNGPRPFRPPSRFNTHQFGEAPRFERRGTVNFKPG